ncbi:hypothetical protein, partial [Eubacterium aggregans]|uniref:hypothetical protein n=1 Tax=Eubacterium aggregans TaxID=81409 RepID=UPI003F419D7F
VACMLFGVVYAKLKEATPLPSFFILGLSFLIMGFFFNATITLIACGIMGAAWGIFYCYFYARCTEIVLENMQGMAIGIRGAVNGISSFFCTYMVTGLISVTGASNSIEVWQLFGWVCLIVGVISLVVYIKEKIKQW